jgi:hypothetical protein
MAPGFAATDKLMTIVLPRRPLAVQIAMRMPALTEPVVGAKRVRRSELEAPIQKNAFEVPIKDKADSVIRE